MTATEPTTEQSVPPQAPPTPETDDKGKGYARVLVAECGTNAARFRLSVSIRKMKVQAEVPNLDAVGRTVRDALGSVLGSLGFVRSEPPAHVGDPQQAGDQPSV